MGQILLNGRDQFAAHTVGIERININRFTKLVHDLLGLCRKFINLVLGHVKFYGQLAVQGGDNAVQQDGTGKYRCGHGRTVDLKPGIAVLPPANRLHGKKQKYADKAEIVDDVYRV